MQKHADVIERIERLRKQLGLNKSRFSGSIGLKPQTYNNFIGKQASKPNIDLVLGLVTRYNVNPNWLLSGIGPVYQPIGSAEGGNGVDRAGSYGSGSDGRMPNAPMRASLEDTLNSLREEVTGLANELTVLRSQYHELSELLPKLIRVAKVNLAGETQAQLS